MAHRVLFVDDEPNVLYALLRTLRQQPYTIITARTADEATMILKSHAVDLVVADENMPGMQGTEFLAWVARHFPHVVRIVLTGQPSVPTTLRAINDAHVFRFLTKPCDDVKLAMAIRDGLAQRDEIESRYKASQPVPT
jgi:DNA-binding NtrC family response regulator